MKKITLIIPAKEGIDIEAIRTIDKSRAEIIVEMGNNPSRNRNKGVKKAKTPYVAFINAHTLLDRKWIDESLKFFKKYPEVDIVGGPQLNHPSEGTFAKASGYALSSPFASAGMSKRYKKTKLDLNADETFLTSANLICKREVFKKIKFDENLYPGEDPKFIDDAKKQKLKIAYSPDIVVYNLRRKSVNGLSKQIFNYGRTRAMADNSIKDKILFSIPSFFVAYLAFLPLLLLINRNLFIIPLILYIILDAIFSIYESAINRNLLSIFYLLWIIALIHITYGLGFIYGLFNNRGVKK